MAQIQYLTPEDGLPVVPRLIGAAEGLTHTYGSIGQVPVPKNEDGSEQPFETVEQLARERRARYILKTSTGSYYIKCYTPREGHQFASSEEILRHISECYSISGRSRVWVLDYH